MNKEQTNHMRMFINTQATMDENTALWNVIPIMVTAKNQFDELLQRIVAVNERTNPDTRAVTDNKEKTLESVAEKTMILAGSLQAFAAFNEDAVLAGRVKLTKSDILQGRETDVEALINPVVKAARENLSNLSEFMVTEGTVTDVETSLDDFKAMIGLPRTIRNQAFAAMNVLEELFDTTNDLLKNKLDKLMIRFEFTNPEFYSEYQRARTIVD